jgi:hypothetical protein
MLFRNERRLYQRSCDLCSKSFLSIYNVKTSFPVYCYNCWWSESWDALRYGQEYQSGRSFFEQFNELSRKVPHLGIVTGQCVNCDYANYTNYSKNSYLVFGCHAVEDSYYGWRMHDSVQCLDCLQIDKSEHCYECVDCDESYGLYFSQDCSHCVDSFFLYDCKGCQDCFFSTGLRNQKYCILNQPYSEEDYRREKKNLNLNSYQGLLQAKTKFYNFLKNYPRRDVFVVHSQGVLGDHIINSKNIRFGFNLKDTQDGAYLESCEALKDALDSTFCGWPAELNYEGISAGCVNSYNVKFSIASWSCTNIDYCDSCHNSKELFGCFGLRSQNKHCLLNRQYSADKYQVLKNKVINEMTKRGEYGEFFLSKLSPFAYNEAIVNEYYLLTKEQALAKGYTWRDDDLKDQQEQDYTIPDQIENISDSITQRILTCEECGKNYKIIIQELEFYRQVGLPVPHQCFNCRHQARRNQRNSRRLYQRNCSKCDKVIQTTYAPNRPERVYCEECYQKEIY